MQWPEALRPRPGSLLWLVLHEIRLTLRSGRLGKRGKWLRAVLLLVYLSGGVLAAIALRGVPIVPRPSFLAIASAVLLTMLSFMAAQALITALRTLYEASDLDLLLSSPLPEGRVMRAKLLGLAGSVATLFLLFILPLTMPAALLGHPRLLAIAPMLGALALVGASFGLALAIALVRTLGARGARTAGQILAALLGAGVFLVSQLGSQRGRGNRIAGLIAWMRESGWGAKGWSAWPARALFGEIGPLVATTAAAAALFALASILFARHFLRGWQSGGEKSARAAKAGGGGKVRALFHASLLRAILAKEVRLLAREPELVFMIVLRLVYLAPVLFLFTRAGGSGAAAYGAAALAAVGAVAAGQLTGSVAWLTLSGEDAPDLLAVSPVDRGRLRRMKLLAALVIVAPVALIVPALIAAGDPAAALIAFAGALAAGWGAGMVELLLGKPGKRSAFAKRKQGSFLTSLLGMLVSMAAGAITGAAAYFA